MTFFRGVLGFGLGRLRMYAPRPIRITPPDASLIHGDRRLRISLVTPVFNQAAFIGATLDSVAAQCYPLLEHIVMDGGSTDGTVERIRQHGGKRSHFESAPDGGQADAINKGFAHASGDIFGWLNGDDILLPGALHSVAEFLERHPDIDVVYGDRLVIDESGQEVGRWTLPPYSARLLSWIDFVPQETLFWRRTAWERVGGRLDTSFQFAMDWDLLVRLRDSGARIAHLPRYIGGFRVHPNQKTSARMVDIGQAEMDRIRSRCLGYTPSRLRRRFATAAYATRYLFHDLRRRTAETPR